MPKRYQNASVQLKTDDELAPFIFREGSISFERKHQCCQMQVEMLAVVVFPQKFQYLGKNLRDADNNFDLAVEKNEKMTYYASERLR